MRKAIIPAAGWGTRFLPATKALPKEMLPIIDKPAIQYIVEEAVAAGIQDILIVTGRHKRAIEDHFDRSLELENYLADRGNRELLACVQNVGRLTDIHFIRQKEPLGLGHAVYCARAFVGDEPFAVLLGDDIIQSDRPCIGQLIHAYQMVGQTIVAVQPVPREHSNRYGMVKPQKMVRPGLWELAAIVEKPVAATTPSDLAVMGRYIIDPAVFGILAHLPPGQGGEIQLTDALDALHTRLGQKLYAYQFTGRRYDIGDKLGYLQATVDFALQRPDLAPALRAYLAAVGGHEKKLDQGGTTENYDLG